jgi:hypothetical protein
MPRSTRTNPGVALLAAGAGGGPPPKSNAVALNAEVENALLEYEDI